MNHIAQRIIQANSCASCSAMHRVSPQAMECRLNPPSVTPLIGQGQNGAPQLLGNVTLFPTVNHSMSCRQYKRSVIVDDRLAGAEVVGAA